MSLVDYSDIAGTYRAVQEAAVTAEDVNSYHILYAQAEVEGVLGSAFTTPFSSNNLTAKDLIIQLTYSRIAPLSADERRNIREDVLGRMQRILDGDEAMYVESGGVMERDTSVAWSTTEDYHPIFTVDKAENWVADSSQIEDLRDERGFT